MKLKKKNMDLISPENKKVKQQPNWILRITLLVIAVPLIILAVILLTSIDKSGKPVVGSRFDKHLDPAITDKQLDEVEKALSYENIDKVELNLKSATLRITIDMSDDANQEVVSNMVDDAYEKVIAILPVDPYFTNQLTEDSTIKMYDLEINVYNYIPDENNREGWQKCVLHKNATEEEVGKDWLSTARNEEVAQEVKNQGAKAE